MSAKHNNLFSIIFNQNSPFSYKLFWTINMVLVVSNMLFGCFGGFIGCLIWRVMKVVGIGTTQQ